MNEITVVMAQINPLVGDIDGNADLILATTATAVATHQADVIAFPELALCGYPPEDLLLRPSIRGRTERALARLRQELPRDVHVVVGYPRSTADGLYNAAGVFHDGEIVAEYAKQCLPNYQVFDEKRYFRAGSETCVLPIRGVPVAVTICEDVWEARPTEAARDAGAALMLNINASPYHIDKQHERITLLRHRTASGRMPIIYVNQVGGQDELVFDGGSFAVGVDGEVVVQAPNYETGLFPVTVTCDADNVCRLAGGEVAAPLARTESVYRALVLGVRDYVDKNRFNGVVLGLSGGIDSALTLAIAVDALGPERVNAVMMPFRYTSQMSKDDARIEAETLGVAYTLVPIEPMFEAFTAALQNEFENMPVDKTEENLQARIRGVLLMAISNKKGFLVLTTGNKSEMAVGYSTLYGDMAGGFDVLKDCPKTLVYELARYRNTVSAAIPERVITRAPSAELAPDQRDEDTLVPYETLDAILALYIEQDLSAEEIIARGYRREDVYRLVRMVDINEYKRRQAPPGVRITTRGFGRDRRYPITSGWRIGE